MQVPTGDMPRHLLLNASRFLVDEATAGDRLLISGVLTTEAGPNASTFTSDRHGEVTAAAAASVAAAAAFAGGRAADATPLGLPCFADGWPLSTSPPAQM